MLSGTKRKRRIILGSVTKTKKNKPASKSGKIDKLIAGLTSLDNKLDMDLRRNVLDKKALDKLKVGAKPFWYSAELGKLERELVDINMKKYAVYKQYSPVKGLTTKQNKKAMFDYLSRLPRPLKDKLIYIRDGFARGISKYINEHYKKDYKVSNAFVKLWEIYSTFPWLLSGGASNSKINMFHMAEAPGQWINTTYNYFKQHMPANTKYDWYANSLNAEHPQIRGLISALKDDYGLIKKYKDRWIWGADGTGDITNPDNIRWYGEYISRKFAGSGGLHVVTGDAGLNIGEAPLEFLQKLDFAQMVMVACTSTPGSSCIIKHFLPFLSGFNKLSSKASGFFMSFMYMYHLMFREFHMFKPLSSSPGSGEFYVVARGFLGLDQSIKDKLLDALGSFRVNQPIFESRDIPRWFVTKVAGFINELTQRNIDNEVIGIEVLKCFVNNPAEIDCSHYLSDAGGTGTFKEQKDKDIRAWMAKYKFKA